MGDYKALLNDPSRYAIQPMDATHADIITRWHYEGQYHIYSMDGTYDELLNGDYYILLCDGTLIGFYCYGKSARVPLHGYDYEDNGCLDMGLGLSPDLCGQGIGASFIKAGILFARDAFSLQCVRLTVAGFNQRAIKVYERAGFLKRVESTHKHNGRPFIIMTMKQGSK